MSDAMIVGVAMNQALLAAEESRDAWKAHAKKTEVNRDEWKALAKKTANGINERDMVIAGMNAIIDAFKEMHPNSPLLNGSGFQYQDGTEKTIARIKYEKSFDEKGREIGIENPEKHRTN
ncbi:hypothetical protein [Thalassospira sp.]|uniref:hypothetical protein n=1 Tax=Thalassospira sp. TaxID=1912094 RepID=UPI002615867D|nr:hypothetical protein [Thalassospira sp.]MCH2274505.1 hypothetical protein [Thalassospira sp.]